MKLRQFVLPIAILIFATTGCEQGDPVPSAVAECGNAAIDAGEICDRHNLNGMTCESLGFGPGDIGCNLECTGYDLAGCAPASSCGDGVIDGNEACDGISLGTTTCESLGLGVGVLGCLSNCSQFDTSGCGPDNSGNTGGNDNGNGGNDNGNGGNDNGGATDPSDPTSALPPGSPCNCSADCLGTASNPGLCVYGVCMQEASSNCSTAGSTTECGQGSRCWGLGETTYQICWPDCSSYSCAGTCDGDDSCAPSASTDCDGTCSPLCNGSTSSGGDNGGSTGNGGNDNGGNDNGGGDSGGTDTISPGVSTNGEVGAPCNSNADCGSTAPDCVTDGFPGGYCTVLECTGGCPGDSACYNIDDGQLVLCLDTCTQTADCRISYDCTSQSICFPDGSDGTGDYRCTETSCDPGYFCGTNGQCIPEAVDMPSGPIPNCTVGAQIPDYRGCNGSGQVPCGDMVQFSPVEAHGYWDYQINGEGSEQYRSWIRQDVMQAVRYATAMTQCLTQNWSYQAYMPLGLGDMSEQNGAIPGTAEGDPGHPAGTHVDGSDMDIAYYQLAQPDNTLRSVCNHVSGGVDEYHCVSQPDILDKWRTAIFIAKLHDHPHLRVIGVDGKVGELMTQAIYQLCGAGWLGGNACDDLQLAYETVDEGMGWFRFHHHHLHVSINEPTGVFANLPGLDQGCMTPGCMFMDTVNRQRTWDPTYVSLKRLSSLKKR